MFPDMRCVVPAGVDTSRGILTGAVLGALLGAEAVTLNANQIPDHHHAINLDTGNDTPDHTHSGGQAATKNFAPGPGVSNIWGGSADNTGGATRHHHNLTGDTAGSGGGLSHPNVQPTIVINFIGRAA